MWQCRGRKTQDKRSLNYESTTPVKAWVSIGVLEKKKRGEPSYFPYAKSEQPFEN